MEDNIPTPMGCIGSDSEAVQTGKFIAISAYDKKLENSQTI